MEISASTFEVWGVRKSGDGKVQVELRPTDGLSGHTTIVTTEAEAPRLGTVIEAVYTVREASE